MASAEAASRAFGTGWVFIPNGASIVDFVMTIAISVAAGGSALIAHFPAIAPARIPFGDGAPGRGGRADLVRPRREADLRRNDVSRSLAVATAASAALVTSILCGAVTILGRHRREHVHDLILRGGPPAVELIRGEVRRLVDIDNRLQVARALDRALCDGEHWHEYLPASRPPTASAICRPTAP
jgi:hypothetical protein